MIEYESLLGRIFGLGKSPTMAEPSRIPENCRAYVIGDIHGRADLLQNIHDSILEDAAAAASHIDKTVIYLGDFVDRGMCSRDVIDMLIESPLPGMQSVHLLGNHDQEMLKFLDTPQPDGSWMNLGGNTTVYSYGIRVPKDIHATKRFGHIQEQLRQRLPDSHLQFLQGLKLSHTIGDYFFVHAGIDPDRALDNQKTADLVWGNRNFTGSGDDFGKIIVHGHTVGNEPVIRSNRICVDTGAFQSNILSCLVLEGDSRRFISTLHAQS